MPLQENLFKKAPLFSKISPECLAVLLEHTKLISYKKGDIVLDQSQTTSTFLYVLEGWVKLSKESASGEEIIVGVLTQHQHCGESFIFDANENESYTAESLTNTDLFTIPIYILKQLMLNEHALSLNFLHAMGKKQQHLTMRVEHLSIQNAVQRIGCFLLRLCNKPLHEKNVVLHFPYNKTLLASRLGMQPETFSRALNKLCEQCDIQNDGDCIIIPDLSKIVEEVCQHCSKVYPCNSSV